MMQELGNAINETLSDSDRIAEGSVIKRAGRVFLVLERRSGSTSGKAGKRGDGRRQEASPPGHSSYWENQLTPRTQVLTRLKIAWTKRPLTSGLVPVNIPGFWTVFDQEKVAAASPQFQIFPQLVVGYHSAKRFR